LILLSDLDWVRFCNFGFGSLRFRAHCNLQSFTMAPAGAPRLLVVIGCFAPATNKNGGLGRRDQLTTLHVAFFMLTFCTVASQKNRQSVASWN
jgi:hypothetical protein